MAGVKLTGLDETRRNVDRLNNIACVEALNAAQDAAAEVAKSAVKAAAPHRTGQLAGSIKVFKSKPKGLSIGASSAAVRILVGPEKKKGYYGYFLAKGWRSAGRKRVARRAGGSAHSQRGVEAKRNVSAPYPDWFDRVASSVDQHASEVWIATFQERMKRSGLI